MSDTCHTEFRAREIDHWTDPVWKKHFFFHCPTFLSHACWEKHLFYIYIMKLVLFLCASDKMHEEEYASEFEE